MTPALWALLLWACDPTQCAAAPPQPNLPAAKCVELRHRAVDRYARLPNGRWIEGRCVPQDEDAADE